jgi:inosine-uridine nucleoside N-ribohydrolase
LYDGDMIATLTEPQRVAALEWPTERVDVVLDTDTYNEIDDQFALAYAARSPERIRLEAVYAAPFHNDRSSGPADGMEKSFVEIGRVLERLGRTEVPTFRGSLAWMPAADAPVASPAADDLIARARADRRGRLYVVAIGAPTNVASALLAAPDIASRIVVVWLGGHARQHWDTAEFNLVQDLHATRVLLDSGVPLVRVPCLGAAEHLRTTEAELAAYVKGHGPIADYLYQTYAEVYADHFAKSRVLWDVVAVAWLIDPVFTSTALMASPLVSDAFTLSHDPRRHLIREVIALNRDAILADLFTRLRG